VAIQRALQLCHIVTTNAQRRRLMHTGHWLVTSGTTTKVLSPWFSKGGCRAIFTYEKIVEIGSPTLTVRVIHKNEEDTGEGSFATAATAFGLVAGTALYTGEFENLKEMVRFQYELAQGEEGTEMLLCRMLAPTWFNKINP
jgi:hypothetical protein